MELLKETKKMQVAEDSALQTGTKAKCQDARAVWGFSIAVNNISAQLIEAQSNKFNDSKPINKILLNDMVKWTRKRTLEVLCFTITLVTTWLCVCGKFGS